MEKHAYNDNGNAPTWHIFKWEIMEWKPLEEWEPPKEWKPGTFAPIEVN